MSAFFYYILVFCHKNFQHQEFKQHKTHPPSKQTIKTTEHNNNYEMNKIMCIVDTDKGENSFFFRKLLHIKSKSKPKTNKMKFGLTKDMVCLSYFSRFKQIEMFCLWSNVHNGHNNFIRVKCAFAGTNDDFFWFWISFHIFFVFGLKFTGWNGNQSWKYTD